MQFDRTKLHDLILYACSKCEPADLGAVKLHKVLYFSDMLFYAVVGSPITGATYRKRPFGPTCDQLLSALSELSGSGQIRVEEVNYFGYRKKQYYTSGEVDCLRLSESERGVIDQVIDFVCKRNSAKSVSEFSHNRAWELAEFGEVLPYCSVFQIFPTQASQEAMEWAEAQADAIAAEKSRSDTLDYVDFAAFRSRVLESRRA